MTPRALDGASAQHTGNRHDGQHHTIVVVAIPRKRGWRMPRPAPRVVQIKRLVPDRRCLKRADSGPTEVAAKGKNLARSGLTPVVMAAPQPWRSRAFRTSPCPHIHRRNRGCRQDFGGGVVVLLPLVLDGVFARYRLITIAWPLRLCKTIRSLSWSCEST